MATSGTSGLQFLHDCSALLKVPALGTAMFTITVSYIVLCSTLRFRRRTNLHIKYPYGSTPLARKPFSAMTLHEAHTIVTAIAEIEFPTLFEKGLQFALFRTYGIPTISNLLVLTRQLASTPTVGKRYADTTVIIAEIYGETPGSVRSIDAFSRLNYLHGHYFRRTTTGPRILEEDMLYTLSLFMNQTVEWINRYEWRQLSDVEICAWGLFHLYMGISMGIDFSFLPSGAKQGHDGKWTDGVHFYHELDAWSKAYEAKVMIPDDNNFETAKYTRSLLCRTYPSFMHNFLGNVMAAAMDDRLRSAIKFPPAPPSYIKNINRFMAIRRFLLRYLVLPRFTFLDKRLVTPHTSPDGRRWFTRYEALPHYVKPTLWNRYGPSSWMSWAIGTPLPGDKGMQPEGWRMGDVGPRQFEGKGEESVAKYREGLRGLDLGGKYGDGVGVCPFFRRV